MEFKITGVVREKENKRPVKGLLVRAFDKDVFFTDLLGNAITASDGTFSLGYEGKDFQELFEKRPDIYLDIYGSAAAKNLGRVGDKPIYTTERYVRFNAGREEFFLIEIPREKLVEDASDAGIVSTPEEGKWKDLIDDYIKTHPVDFHYDPKRGFMAPRLKCTSNFGPEIRDLDLGEPAIVTVKVTNKGNGISFDSYVGVYEGPVGYTHLLRDYRLCDYKVITINQGQTVNVKLNWSRLLTHGRIVGICFDPFLDPRGFRLVEQYNDHITSVHYL
ncbi:MAG: hypothetical protein V1933_06040 [Candidatus Omnitrophota bacterium]